MNTKASTNFKTVSARKELWGDPQPQVAPKDITLEKLKGPVNKGIPKLFKNPGHDFSPRMSNCNTDLYDSIAIKNALEKTSSFKKAPSLVNMAQASERDNLIFNLDKDYLKELKRETRKKNFNLNDYLPNTLKKTMASNH